MTRRFSYPIQDRYSREGWSRNTPASVPSPPPTDLPAPCWFSSPVRTSWTGERARMPAPVQAEFDAGKINFFAQWSSPIYDLKPYLRGFTANGMSGRSDDERRATPVWVGGGSGAGGKLFVQVELRTDNALFTDTSNFDGVKVQTFEQAHVGDPGKVNRVGSVQDITANFSLDGNKYIVLGFVPFGEGLPIRYYKQTVWFTRLLTSGTPVPFTIEAAFY